MKTLFYIFLTFTVTGLYAQSDYFDGNRTYCNLPDNERAKALFPLGKKCVNLNVRLGSAFQCFTELIEMDSSFCDAYFWAAYTLRLSNKNKEALTYYYLADSFSQNKAIEFKQNLAYLSMQLGADSLARKKYEEMKEYFPNSPEGFYGIALTSTIIGDVEYGLKNIDIAESKNIKQSKDILFIKAILLTLNGKYQASFEYFEQVKSDFSSDDFFNGNYALALYEVGAMNNDKKMLEKARKHFKKVKNKENLSESVRAKFKSN